MTEQERIYEKILAAGLSGAWSESTHINIDNVVELFLSEIKEAVDKTIDEIVEEQEIKCQICEKEIARKSQIEILVELTLDKLNELNKEG